MTTIEDLAARVDALELRPVGGKGYARGYSDACSQCAAEHVAMTQQMHSKINRLSDNVAKLEAQLSSSEEAFQLWFGRAETYLQNIDIWKARVRELEALPRADANMVRRAELGAQVEAMRHHCKAALKWNVKISAYSARTDAEYGGLHRSPAEALRAAGIVAPEYIIEPDTPDAYDEQLIEQLIRDEPEFMAQAGIHATEPVPPQSTPDAHCTGCARCQDPDYSGPPANCAVEAAKRKDTDARAKALWEWRQENACKVCSNTPDENGVIDHGRGCYTQSENGGGQSCVEPFAWPVPAPAEPSDTEMLDWYFERAPVAGGWRSREAVRAAMKREKEGGAV